MILITGITGKSGRWFLKKLMEEEISNNKYRVVLRNASKNHLFANSMVSFDIVYGDLADINFVGSIMKNVTTVLHISGIHTSLNIVKAAIENNVKRLILVHTTGIYSKYKFASKNYLKIEEEINSRLNGENINLTILRPTMIYGSIEDGNIIVFIKMVDKFNIFPVVNHAKFELQPVHEKDLGYAYYQVLINEESTRNKNYNLSGKNPIMLIDIFKIIGKHLGKRNVFISIPFPIAYCEGLILYLLTFGKIDYREKIQRLVEPRIFNHTDASRDFGYSPVGFEDGILDEITEYKEVFKNQMRI